MPTLELCGSTAYMMKPKIQTDVQLWDSDSAQQQYKFDWGKKVEH